MKFSGVILLLLIAVAGYLSWGEASQKRYSPMDSNATIVELDSLKKQTVISSDKNALATKVSQKIQIISTYQSAADMPANLVALRPDTPIVRSSIDKPKYTPYARVTKKHHKAYIVSMIFIAPNNRYAVIDNHFSREGDVLPDGGTVMEIAESHVKVKRGTITQTFKMESTSS